MNRRLVTILSALPFLLLVAVVVLWVRSYWVSDALLWSNDGYRVTGVQSSMGLLCLADAESLRRDVPPLTRSLGLTYFTHRPATAREFERGFGVPERRWEALGILAIRGDLGRGALARALLVPFWLPTALAALPAGYSLFTYCRRKRRTTHRLCPTCAYDLRATPDRCPECGRLAAAMN